MKTLIRCRVLWHLIWVCTVYLYPKNGTLGLYGLTFVGNPYNFNRIINIENYFRYDHTILYTVLRWGVDYLINVCANSINYWPELWPLVCLTTLTLKTFSKTSRNVSELGPWYFVYWWLTRFRWLINFQAHSIKFQQRYGPILGASMCWGGKCFTNIGFSFNFVITFFLHIDILNRVARLTEYGCFYDTVSSLTIIVAFYNTCCLQYLIPKILSVLGHLNFHLSTCMPNPWRKHRMKQLENNITALKY